MLRQPRVEALLGLHGPAGVGHRQDRAQVVGVGVVVGVAAILPHHDGHQPRRALNHIISKNEKVGYQNSNDPRLRYL
jgi:hypothetical protein